MDRQDRLRNLLLCTGNHAPSLHQDDVSAPAAVQATEFLTPSENPKAGSAVQLGCWPRSRERFPPGASRRRSFSDASTRASTSFAADPAAAGFLRDIDTDFGDSGIDTAAGNRAQRQPRPRISARRARHQPTCRQMARVPFGPVGGGRSRRWRCRWRCPARKMSRIGGPIKFAHGLDRQRIHLVSPLKRLSIFLRSLTAG